MNMNNICMNEPTTHVEQYMCSMLSLKTSREPWTPAGAQSLMN